MLLQSHCDRIQLLPALPPGWADGSIEGLRARGAFEIGMTWQGGRLQSATIKSLKGKPCRIYLPDSFSVTCDGDAVDVRRSLEGPAEFETSSGKTYVLASEHSP